MHKSATTTVVLLCTALLLSGVAGCAKKKDDIPLSENSIADPVQEFSETSLHFYNKGMLQWKLDADYMCKPLNDTGTIMVTPVALTLYDSLGGIRSKVLADSGKIANTMNSYNIWGDVYIRTRDSMVVRTERLKWFKEKRKVESDTFVQIQTKKGDILRGKGLDATEDFSNFKFLRDVTGTFPEFNKRVESNDDKLF